jgi:DNA-binding MarR family transcriptional regulator
MEVTNPDSEMSRSVLEGTVLQMVEKLPSFALWAEGFVNSISPTSRLAYRSYGILYRIRTSDPEGRYMTSTDLANFFGIRPSVVTVAINALVEEGCLERRNNNRDRRQYHFVVTEKGRKISEEIEQAFYDEIRNVMSGLDSTQMAELARSLDVIGDITAELNRRRNAARA